MATKIIRFAVYWKFLFLTPEKQTTIILT